MMKEFLSSCQENQSEHCIGWIFDDVMKRKEKKSNLLQFLLFFLCVEKICTGENNFGKKFNGFFEFNFFFLNFQYFVDLN